MVTSNFDRQEGPSRYYPCPLCGTKGVLIRYEPFDDDGSFSVAEYADQLCGCDIDEEDMTAIIEQFEREVPPTEPEQFSFEQLQVVYAVRHGNIAIGRVMGVNTNAWYFAPESWPYQATVFDDRETCAESLLEMWKQTQGVRK